MKNPSLLAPYFQRLETLSTARWYGRVTKAVGHIVESEGPFCSLGECCEVMGPGDESHSGEVVGFRGSTVLSMPVERLEGIRYGDRIATWGAKPSLRVGEELLGRVIDGTGRPIDSLADYVAHDNLPLHASGPLPLDRI